MKWKEKSKIHRQMAFGRNAWKSGREGGSYYCFLVSRTD
jgi:hypothetical protein